MKQKRMLAAGFTLVELLIVIALIAILSVAVLATINPIEQTNKARDAKFRNDAAEVLGALERYYASQNQYPWNGVGTTVDSNTDFIGRSSDPRMGVVAAVGASGVDFTSDGVLITTSELKSSFRGKDPFSASATEENSMYVYHNATTNSNYVCYHPKATANRQGTKLNDLKCIDPTGVHLYNLTENGCGTMPVFSNTAVGSSIANVVCVPEGSITSN